MDNGASSYRRFLDGDREAFDEIIKEYRNSLTLFLERYVHDMATAEDLAIDAFMELLVHPKRYNFKTSLKTYLFMIGRSRALDYLKHRKRLTMISLESEETEELPAEDNGEWRSSVEEAVLRDEQKRMVNEALDKLPEELRLAVHLVYFEELSYEEAAKVMGKKRKQVDNLLYRAKKELRTILEKDGVMV